MRKWECSSTVGRCETFGILILIYYVRPPHLRRRDEVDRPRSDVLHVGGVSHGDVLELEVFPAALECKGKDYTKLVLTYGII